MTSSMYDIEHSINNLAVLAVAVIGILHSIFLHYLNEMFSFHMTLPSASCLHAASLTGFGFF